MSIEDRFQISNVIAEYSLTFDGQDADAWSALFTSDGSVRGGSRRAIESLYRTRPTARLRGR